MHSTAMSCPIPFSSDWVRYPSPCFAPLADWCATPNLYMVIATYIATSLSHLQVISPDQEDLAWLHPFAFAVADDFPTEMAGSITR